MLKHETISTLLVVFCPSDGWIRMESFIPTDGFALAGARSGAIGVTHTATPRGFPLVSCAGVIHTTLLPPGSLWGGMQNPSPAVGLTQQRLG